MDKDNEFNKETRIPKYAFDKNDRDRDIEDDGPPAKIRKPDTSTQDDGITCPICFEAWSNAGPHRLVSLKCGHLFGAQCVERWLKGQPTRERSCPLCKSKAAVKDIRYLYANRLVAADTSHIVGLQKQIDLLQAEKKRKIKRRNLKKRKQNDLSTK